MAYAKTEGLVDSLKLPAYEPFLPHKYLQSHRSLVDANIVDQT